MANLDVQPKKKPNYLLAAIIGLAVGVIIFFLVKNLENKTDDNATPKDTTASTVVVADNWNDVNFESATTKFDELPADVTVRTDGKYTIYGIGEDILFNTESASLKAADGGNLKDIAASLAKRFGESNIRIYGYTDATGTKGYNMKLAEDRAMAVKDWLVNSGNIAAGRLSLQPIGEARPVATNETEAGRQQNRRVEIIARNSK